MKLIVTELGPIDRHPVGTDVTGLYDDETAQRLIAAGYLTDDGKPAKKSRKREVSKPDVN